MLSSFLYLTMFFPVVWCLICISFWYFAAVEKALLYLDRDELPPHWDRDLLFGMDESSGNSDSDGGFDSDVRKFYSLVTDWLLHGVYQINPKCVSFLLFESYQSKVCFQLLFFPCLTWYISKLSLPIDTVVTSCTPCFNAQHSVFYPWIHLCVSYDSWKKTASTSPNNLIAIDLCNRDALCCLWGKNSF